MSELVVLLFMAVGLLAWFEGRTVQEIATTRARRACEAAGVQFLDDVAPAWRLRFVRDAGGRLRLQRLYTFDYSTADGERRRGAIVMHGRTPVSLQLETHGAAARSNHFVP